jgi:hypothetical protein
VSLPIGLSIVVDQGQPVQYKESATYIKNLDPAALFMHLSRSGPRGSPFGDQGALTIL